MASHCLVRFPSSLSSSPPFPDHRPRTRKALPKSWFYPSVSSQISILPDYRSDDDNDSKKIRSNLLKLSVTLTVVSTSLIQNRALAATATKERKRGMKKQTVKKPEALTPQEVKVWSQGLPVVSTRVPYTEVLELKKEGKLKHVIKAPNASLRQRAEAVMVVLEDAIVLRTVLPSAESNRSFWKLWDELEMNSVCVNAFAPPIKYPEIPNPYLGFLAKAPEFLHSLLTHKKEEEVSPVILQIRRAREELKRRKKEDITRMRREREKLARASRIQEKEEQRRARTEERRKNFEASLRRAKLNNERMSIVWMRLSHDSNLVSMIAFAFFVLFYYGVVVNYKKQRKDYEDRMKIEKAEAEERRKIKKLERMEGLVGAEDEVEEAKNDENAYEKMAKQFMKSGARVRRRGKRAPQFLDANVDVKFEDVAGLGKIRVELEEIVRFFTHADVYRRRGLKIPGGILLCGPPGVGKTLLAKAVAGEAGVNFFSISASQFVEIYVGVGAARVRSLYQEAKENAPSVVFIDELDAVGRERGLIKGSGGQERDATLNQLLVCLDGFEGKGEVITIASTNRPDILDPALVRPGRFDRKIHIPKPGVIGRIEILKVHARKKPMAEDIDYLAVAGMTDGMVGAELANIVEVAAVNMMRDGRTEITTDDLLQAAQIEERGLLDKKERSPESWKQIAINEAATAVVALNFPDFKNVQFITIAPRAGRELGYVRVKLDYMRYGRGMLTRQSLLDHITIQLAPRAADELWYGEGQLSTIGSETTDNARSEARSIIVGGLSGKHYGQRNFWVPDLINEIDEDALLILHDCYERAKELLQQNMKLLDAVVGELVEKKSLTKEEFWRLVELHGSPAPKPTNIPDVRAARRAKSQEIVMNSRKAVAGSNV